METRAAVLERAGDEFVLQDVMVEEPRADEVVVRIEGVGLCHSDIVFAEGHRPYPMPAVLGHEGAGIVVSIGSEVTDFAPGDTVILGFSSCEACPRCDEGLPGYCADFAPLNFIGSRRDGTTAYRRGDTKVASHFFGQSSFARHAVTRAGNLVKVPETSLDLALLGPLGCGIQTGAGAVMRALACAAGSSLVVVGGGSVGLSALMAGSVQGCAKIVLVEPMAERRALAMELGASATIDPLAGPLTEQILALLPGGADYIVDTTGRPDVATGALDSLAVHGTLALLGVPHDAAATIPLPLSRTMLRGHRVIGVVEGDSDQKTFIPELIALREAGRFPFDRLIRTFPLSQINEAIAAQARGECIKVVLLPDADGAEES